MASYEIWLDDARGRRLKLVEQVQSMTAVKVKNNIGSVNLVLSSAYDDYVKLDGIVEIWRKAPGSTLRLFNAYFTRKLDYIDENNIDVTQISGQDGISLLDRRIVAYAAGSTNCDMNTYADDICKIVVRENCATSATDTDRNWAALGFTIDPNTSQAQTVSKGFSYRNVLDLCQDLADASRQKGTRLYFDVTPYSSSDNLMGWNFSTNINQPGADHSGTDMVIFGPHWGNMDGAHITFDHGEEATVVYAGGQGLGTSRSVEEVSDTAREISSPWNRCEVFYNCSGQASDTAQVYAAGQARLSELRPKMSFAGNLKEGSNARFGVDWYFGDKVVLAYRGFEYNAIITQVTMNIDNKGKETISAGFELISGGGSLAGIMGST